MNTTLSILLVEDDVDVCENFKNYIDKLSDAQLIGITNNSHTAIDYVRDYQPDAVILDLELHKGCGNGILFLNELKNSSLNKPYILVTTNNSSTITYESARESGADFIMFKHEENYSEKYAVDFLRMIKDIIFKANSINITDASHPPTPEDKNKIEKRLLRTISKQLDYIGISPKVLGYKYLCDAIILLIQQPEVNIYAFIGKKYKKTNVSVERAMQNAINKAWRTCDINDLLNYYTARINPDRGVPTISEFIYYYANKIKNEL